MDEYYMDRDILYHPEEVWDLVCEGVDELPSLVPESSIIIATWHNTGIEVTVSGFDPNIGGASLRIYMYNDLVEELCLKSEEEAVSLVYEVYEHYLDYYEDDDFIYQMRCGGYDPYDPEQQLFSVTDEFLTSVTNDLTIPQDVITDCMEHFLEYMYRKHGMSIYRPMTLVDEKGEEFESDYPYEEMVFDDEDNPIYK